MVELNAKTRDMFMVELNAKTRDMMEAIIKAVMRISFGLWLQTD